MKLRSVFNGIILLAFGATGGWAQPFVWVGNGFDGTIAAPLNWSGGSAPGFTSGTENVTFGDATQTTILLGSVSGTLQNLTFSSSTVPYLFTGTSLPTFTITGNITTSTANPYPVVFASSIAVALSSGSHTISVAAGSAVTSLANVSGSGASIAKTGAGTLILSGANTYTGGTIIHNGTLQVNGGVISHPSSSIVVGQTSGDTGTLAITSGGAVSSNYGSIGSSTGSFGMVTVNGSGSSFNDSGSLDLGYNGSGALFITNGGSVSSFGSSLGHETAGSGSVSVDGVGSTWSLSDSMVVGDVGIGTLSIANGGSVSSTAGMSLGNVAGSTGTVAVAGHGSALTTANGLNVGPSGSGALFIVNGGSATNNDGYIGMNSDGSGTVTVSGAGSTWTNSSYLVVGNYGTAALTVANGGSVSSAVGQIGSGSGGSGTATITGLGSSWTTKDAGGSLLVGGVGTGMLTILDGGSVNVDGGLGSVVLGWTGVGLLNIGAPLGGDAAAGGMVEAASVTTANGSGTVQFNTTASSSSPYYFTNDGTSAGRAVVIADATQVINTNGYNVLTAANTYTGGTTITGGTLAAGNNASLGLSTVTLDGGRLNINAGVTLTNPVNFGSNGGTLGGNGAFGSSISVGSNIIVSPGNSPGTLTFGAGLTFDQAGAYDWQIQSVTGTPGQSTTWDLVSVDGALNITATPGSPFTIKVLSLDPLGLPGFVSDFSSGNSYSWTMASATGGISGFDQSVFAINASGFQNPLGSGSFFLTSDGTNLMMNFTPVPEPSTYALMAAGLAMLFWRRRRNRGG